MFRFVKAFTLSSSFSAARLTTYICYKINKQGWSLIKQIAARKVEKFKL